MDTGDHLMLLPASNSRRWLARLGIAGAGVMMIAAGLQGDTVLAARVMAIACGLVGLGVSQWLWHRSGGALILKQEGLFDDQDTPIVRIDEIDRVERGILTNRPANGFTIRLKKPGPRHWHPGLWSRTGRRLGIGGMTSGPLARAMADRIALMVEDQSADP